LSLAEGELLGIAGFQGWQKSTLLRRLPQEQQATAPPAVSSSVALM
jgi:ABC-type phosphate/phosphonate transport system ATPase subunit